jgi:hypothetical protein
MEQEYKLIVKGRNLPDLSKDLALQLDCSFINDKPTKIISIKVEKVK